jgi:hypothetical protein
VDLKQASAETEGPAVIFLPGVVAPAEARYAPLIGAFGGGIRAYTKDLELYSDDPSRPGYSIETEVAGLLAAADTSAVRCFRRDTDVDRQCGQVIGQLLVWVQTMLP